MSLLNRNLPTGRLIHSRPSPNFNERPNDGIINCIVIHYTDFMTMKESLDCLTDPNSNVSSHYLINDDGMIYQLVADDKRAWHAGISCWCGHENINNNSIGIELQNGGMTYKKQFGEWPPYPDVQMHALADLVHDLQIRFSIPANQIIGHSDIAPTRKIDPGPHFNWDDLRERL
ncbi:MAG: N-acetylmuramoyl-L-alanine amidase [Pseudomonadota bacterium]